MARQTLKQTADNYLKSIYYDETHPARFGSLSTLLRHAKKDKKIFITRDLIAQWLTKQDTYTKFRKHVDKFPRRQAIVRGYFHQVDADLAFMEQYQKHNKGFKYLLVVIDILSKFLLVRPLKTKRPDEVKNAFIEIFKHRKPTIVRTDQGTEFVNKIMSAYFKKEGITHRVTQNTKKAFFAERVIKTLKISLHKMMEENKTKTYIHDLPKAVEAYNNQRKPLTGLPPSQITEENDVIVALNMLKKMERKAGLPVHRKYRYNIGDSVRVRKVKGPFTRGFHETFSEELFLITHREIKQYLPLYKLKDTDNTPILGTFYEPQLCAAQEVNNQYYRIEKILKRRRVGKQREILVKWYGWPEKFASWIKESDIKDNTTQN